MSVQALRRPTRHSCAHAAHCDSPGEFGRLWKVSPKSAGPIRGAHSACACHAALSSVHEIGPHSSELAVRFAKEKGVSLSDKELKPVVNDPVEDGLGPGGRSAKLLQHHCRHAPVQSLQIISVTVAICPAFGHSDFVGHAPFRWIFSEVVGKASWTTFLGPFPGAPLCTC